MTITRRRKQVGYLYKASGVWYVRHHDDRVKNGQLVREQVSTRVGLVKDFPAKELAKKEAARLLKPINEGIHKPESVQTIADYADNHFFPDYENMVRPSTYAGYKARWRQLKPWCGELRMRDTTTADVKRVWNAITEKGNLNHDSVRALRQLLRLIFSHAIGQGVLINVVNPVTEAKVPHRAEEELDEETYAYSLEEVMEMLRWLPEPARTAVATAGCTGIRRGELAGLLWENFDPKKRTLKITRSVWEGQATKPKTRKSAAPVPLIKVLVQMLEAHRIRCAQEKVAAAERAAAKLQKALAKALKGGGITPERQAEMERTTAEAVAKAKALAANLPLPTTGPMFASEKGTPLNMNNVLNRQILPALDRCTCGKTRADHGRERHQFKLNESLPRWHGWHGFRRGLATNLKRLGVDLKTIQDILRHAHISITADIYTKEVSEQSVEAMQRLEKEIESKLQQEQKSEEESAYSAVNLQ